MDGPYRLLGTGWSRGPWFWADWSPTSTPAPETSRIEHAERPRREERIRRVSTHRRTGGIRFPSIHPGCQQPWAPSARPGQRSCGVLRMLLFFVILPPAFARSCTLKVPGPTAGASRRQAPDTGDRPMARASLVAIPNPWAQLVHGWGMRVWIYGWDACEGGYRSTPTMYTYILQHYPPWRVKAGAVSPRCQLVGVPCCLFGLPVSMYKTYGPSLHPAYDAHGYTHAAPSQTTTRRPIHHRLYTD